ncbi:hypothetical protein Ancab_032013 [Ancistrocladus abbreviatus]
MDKLAMGVSENVNNSCGLKQPDPGIVVAGEDMVNELVTTFVWALCVKEVNCVVGNDLPSNKEIHRNLEDKNIVRDLDSAGATARKCLGKCATFPVRGHVSYISCDEEDKTPGSQPQENSSYSRSISLPTPWKLVSALKGSREKEGAPSRKLNVSWAPDVYDPLPTSLSHTPKKKSQQQFRNKKHGKGKQKGKNMRNGGSGPKDKKHYRKIAERSDHCLDYCAADRVMSRNYKPSAELDFVGDNHGDTTDSNCGSSFLRKACSTVHIPYAEAT